MDSHLKEALTVAMERSKIKDGHIVMSIPEEFGKLVDNKEVIAELLSAVHERIVFDLSALPIGEKTKTSQTTKIIDKGPPKIIRYDVDGDD